MDYSKDAFKTAAKSVGIDSDEEMEMRFAAFEAMTLSFAGKKEEAALALARMEECNKRIKDKDMQ